MNLFVKSALSAFAISALTLVGQFASEAEATKPTPYDRQTAPTQPAQAQPNQMPSSHQMQPNYIRPQTSSMTQSRDDILKAFPAPEPGINQYVISVPQQVDEQAYRVGLMVVKMQLTDGINLYSLGEDLIEIPLLGWGYSYYEFTGSGKTMSTLMAPRPGVAPVKRLVQTREKLIRYNSRMPIVVYAPQGFEVHYRIFAAGPSQSAQAHGGVDPVPPSGTYGAANTLSLNVDQPIAFPEGAFAEIRLYDARLADTDSTYGLSKIRIDQLPTELPLPAANPARPIAGPAVSVSVRDSQGRLLFVTDTAVSLEPGVQPSAQLKKVF